MPKVLKSKKTKSPSSKTDFPVPHYSASSMVKFSTNPILFKVQYMNGDRFDTAQSVSGVLGLAFHHAMEVYYGGSEELIISNEAEAIEMGLKGGLDYVDKINDGFVNYSKTIPNKQTLSEIFAKVFKWYVEQMPYRKDSVFAVEDELKELIDVEWRGQRLTLPVALKGRIDRIDKVDGKVKIYDYKTCYQYSNPEKIDGAKIIQAVTYYLLAYAAYGEEPYSVTFQEVKYTKNADKTPQVREYELVFAENDLFFDFYFRLYEDMTRALNGEMVYVPNVNTMYDNEISIIAYIHRLDIPEDTAALMKKHKVQNITELLKREIQGAGNMRKLMKAVEDNFVTAKSIDYTNMKNEEKIQTKLMEHGMVLAFDSVVHGATVDLYMFSPSIGIKMSKVRNYADDVAQILGATGVRVLAPIPGTSFIGFEVPRIERQFPSLPDGDGFDIAVGETVMGTARRFDIRSAPHMLVAGAAGSGKSVFLSSLVNQLSRIPNVEIHLFDPKMVELSQHQDDANVVEYESGFVAINSSLEYLVDLMNERYAIMAKAKVRNISEIPGIPYKFVVIDEYGDLIMSKHTITRTKYTGKVFASGPRAGKEEVIEEEINISDLIERSILLLAQKARAAGIHVIIATQRPSVDVVSGTIKANFPTKVVFRTAKTADSLVVIDEPGAEKLAGKGDMLFCGDHGVERLQGYMV